MCLSTKFIHHYLLLLGWITSKHSGLKTTNVYYLTVSEDQEIWAQGFSWGCHQDVVGTAVIWRLDWGWKILFQDGAPTWLLAGGLGSSPCGRLQRAAWASSQHGDWLSPEWVTQERGWSSVTCVTLFIRRWSLSLANTQDGVQGWIGFHVLKGRVSKYCGHILFTYLFLNFQVEI